MGLKRPPFYAIIKDQPLNAAVIGAGPAGEAAAKKLKSLQPDLDVTLIEKEEAGGLCLNKGCIPSKTLLEHVRKTTLGGQKVDWKELQEFKNQVVSGIRSQLESNLKRLKVNLVRAEAKFKDKNSLVLNNTPGNSSLTFDKAILTAGTEVFLPPPLDQFKSALLDSSKILDISETPKSIVIVGGGAVGLEFACLLNAAGSQVTVIELTNQILPGEDSNVAQTLARTFEARGMVIKTESKVTELKKSSTGWNIELSNKEKIQAEQLLVCVGRTPALDGFDLDKGGIQKDKHNILLNEKLQTTNSNVFAAGDVTGLTRLAHAAAAMGETAAQNALGQSAVFNGSLVPRCLYTWPEVASVGQWKYELEAQGKPVKAARAFFKGSSKALAAGETDGFVQVVSDPGSGHILGAQIIGSHATELIHIFSVALHQKMTTKDLGEVMFAHPTLAESVREAVLK